MNNASVAKKRTRAAGRRPARGVHGGIPTFFRATCHAASQGGASGYASAGWHLASSVGGEVPYDVELDDWVDEVDVLQQLAAHDDRGAVWTWFAAHYPRAMTLVPARRRDQFAAGVRRAWEDGRIAV
jgi:hypothetical protein